MNIAKSWILAARPKTLFASLSPIIIGISFSFYIYNQINWLVASLTIVAAVLIQIGSNYANDAYDYLKGADNDKLRKGPPRMAQKGVLSTDNILTVMYGIFIISVFVGFYLALIGGWLIIVIGLLSILFAIAYTGGPFPLGYHGLGDISVFIFFGLIATMGTIYLQSASIVNSANLFDYRYPILLISIAIGCLNTSILVINNLRDYKSDKECNKKTLVVLWGERFGCFEYMFLLIISLICFTVAAILLNNHIMIYLMIFNLFLSVFLIQKIFNYRTVNLNIMLEKTSQFTFLNALLFGVSIFITIL